ncbi:hypothetical protein Forpe1208_v009111 [Fusarium oxysporum f. sp. rapae]|uniref:Uncharacterized protein n=1 Tax=Fusarium oxysporum f. sp. rapae TaxID=485398 RepID=A0A8J5TVW3_FUSOX|nr:hypothetical protein Forpe1208_v009111 [Fusarium oxysporum f. sp. rapae]
MTEEGCDLEESSLFQHQLQTYNKISALFKSSTITTTEYKAPTSPTTTPFKYSQWAVLCLVSGHASRPLGT